MMSLFNKKTKLIKASLRKVYLAFAVLFIAYIPLLYRLLNPKFVPAHFSGSFSFIKLIKIFVQLSGWIYPSSQTIIKLETMEISMLNNVEWLLVLSFGLLIILLFALFITGVLRRNKKTTELNYILSWLFVPSIISFVALFSTISAFGSIRYIIFVVPAYLLIASYGISALRPKMIVIILLLFTIFSTSPIISYYSNINNPQYRESMHYIEENFEQGDIVLANIESVRVPLAYYSKYNYEIIGVSNAEDVKKLGIGKKSIWLVSSMTKYTDQSSNIGKYLDANYKLQKEKDFFNVKVSYYLKTT